MKKITLVIVAICTLLSLSACTKSGQTKINSYNPNETIGSVPNPNMVTGKNTDVHRLGTASDTMARVASQVPGVQRATVFTNGGTAYVRVTLDGNVKTMSQMNKVKNEVFSKVQAKMPSYKIRVFATKNKNTQGNQGTTTQNMK